MDINKTTRNQSFDQVAGICIIFMIFTHICQLSAPSSNRTKTAMPRWAKISASTIAKTAWSTPPTRPRSWFKDWMATS